MSARGGALLSVLLAACSADRVIAEPPPTFESDVAPILAARCAACHGDAEPPAAGWSVTTYLSTIACVEPSGAVATLPAENAPVLAALATPPHVGLLSEAERKVLARWVDAGAPAFAGTVHAPGIVDPRSADFHGAILRSKRWSPMLDGESPDACGRCHEGAPGAVPGVTFGAPGATACTTCHAEAGGPLACDTCHGSNARAYPPRDLCFFPADAAIAGPHAAHVEPSSINAAGLPCSTCHPTPDAADVIGGLHGDGTVELGFDAARIGPEASFDASSGACAVTCHDLGGTTPRPAWTGAGDVVLACTSCHGSPPAGHFPGACSQCHAEANATGTALTGGPLHLNGRVDVGNGDGTCGACHGSGGSAWPTTAAHPAHETPTLSAPVDCASCHVVPPAVIAPGHLDGVVEVTFAGLAVARGATPSWDGATCTNVACHGAKLPDPPGLPSWTDASGAASTCGACHGVPPADHTASTSCNRTECHGAEVDIDGAGKPTISTSGRALHIDGAIEP